MAIWKDSISSGGVFKRLIAHAPKLDTPRWSDLQEAALRVIGPLTGPMDTLPEFPELPERQRHRYASKTSEFKNI